MQSAKTNMYKRFQSYMFPMVFVPVAVYACALTLFDILRGEISIGDVFADRGAKVPSMIFSRVWMVVKDTIFKLEEASNIPMLVAQASGTIVEVGPASGNQLGRYNKSRITHIYGIEPNVSLHDQLRASIKRHGLEGKYTIIPCGAEDTDRLQQTFGLREGSVDTVLVISVLCSVPRPQEIVRSLYRLLKPGGQMIFYEHVQAKDPLSRRVQDFYNLFWPYMMGGCNMNRPSGGWVVEAGKWKSARDVHTIDKEDPWLVLPHANGIMIKA